MIPSSDVDRRFSHARINTVKFLLISLVVSGTAYGQVPADFHWVDFKREVENVQKVTQALKLEDYTAIREIGIDREFALVMAVKRESRQTTRMAISGWCIAFRQRAETSERF